MKVLLVDDQKLFVDSMRAILETLDEELEIVGTASDGQEALQQADLLRPELILMDVRMPVLDGVEATRRILLRHPTIRIIMLTTFEDDEYVQTAISHGARGYLLKSISATELVTALKAVAGGMVAIDPHVVAGMVKSPPALRPSPPPWIDALSRRERQILGLILQGYHNREIAETIHAAEQTVRNYASRIYDKIGAADRAEAARIARESGLF
ncbi:two component transcriptional regulator, LuxR family [Alkalispirochaeta americana]|uniref:Two component transcriptional regulator, LuxR family n=1 Tax=Alkalispirochaeta americana TaxID=159291 RepID=A0A1N6UCB7_9SPIO|nr:response regulator transcription factor [Alkalispirochaeta americana]SIQ63244.1 two component transcriptional regulator, LuxR family [Alkalispirochaeta americana]